MIQTILNHYILAGCCKSRVMSPPGE